MTSLGDDYLKLLQFSDAEPLFHDALKGYRRIYGDTYPGSVSCAQALLLAYTNQKKLNEADALCEEFFKPQCGTKEGDARYAGAVRAEADVLLSPETEEKARQLYQESLQIRRNQGDVKATAMDLIRLAKIARDPEGQ